MSRKNKRNLVNLVWPGARRKNTLQTRIEITEGALNVTREKDQYTFSSVYPNEAVMKRVEAILRDNHKKDYGNRRLILGEE